MNEEKLREIRADTCYHEAAHAIFAYHAGLPIRQVYATEELQAECVAGYPLEPLPWQGIDLAAGILAGAYAAYYRRGREMACMPFEEFVQEASFHEGDVELGVEEAPKGDEAQVLKILQLVAESPQTKAAIRQIEDQITALRSIGLLPGAPPLPEVPPWDDVEKSYEQACEEAVRNVELWWDEIRAVAERLIEVGHLDGDECVELIEGAYNPN